MKKIFVFSFFVVILMLPFIFGTAGADYSFEIPTAQTTVEIESDGSMTVFVEYLFKNLGQKLDYIDIGLPNNNYTLRDITVQINGVANNRINVTKADYDQTGLRYGITLEMGGDAIPTGESALVSVTIPNLKKNLYDATSETIDGEEVNFAGFQFSPNYFSSKFAKGTTKYSFIIVFPPEVGDGFAYYYEPEKWVGEKQPQAWLDEDGCVVYEWYFEKADMHTAYTFGGKFIKNALTSTANVSSNTSSGGSSFAFSKSAFWETITGALPCLIPIVIVFGFVVGKIKDGKSGTLRGRTTTSSYFPPQVKTDGEGIKRGLTAVEAAILLEVDLERVISMILYGLAKKNVIQVISMEPLNVEVSDPLPEGLNEYEIDFIAALQEKETGKKKTKMRETMHRLILGVSKKVEGFSLTETRAYYKAICDKAWAQVEAADTPELKSKLLGDNFGWAMLQDDPEKKVSDTFSSYDMYPPTWWWRVDPGYRRPIYRPSEPHSPSFDSDSSDNKRSIPSGSGSKPTSMPVLPGAMFARTITDSARKFSNSLVGNSRAFESTVKNRTNPTPVSSVSSSSHRHGGGGGSSSCACACACDSCACACAGGGR